MFNLSILSRRIIVDCITIIVTLSKLQVLKLANDLVLAFDQILKLLVSGPDFLLEGSNDFVSFVIDALLKLGKFVLKGLKVILEVLENGLCVLGDNTID